MLSDPPGWRSPSSISRPVPAPGPRPRGPGPFGRPKKSFLASTDLGDHPNIERRYTRDSPSFGDDGQIGDNGDGIATRIGAMAFKHSVVRRCACTTVHACRRTAHMCWSQRERALPALLHCAGPWLDDKHRAVLAGLRRRRRCPPVSWQPWSTAATVAADATWHCSQMVIAAHALLTTTARALTCCTLSSHSDGPRDHPEACPVYPCGRRALSYSGTR